MNWANEVSSWWYWDCHDNGIRLSTDIAMSHNSTIDFPCHFGLHPFYIIYKALFVCRRHFFWQLDLWVQYWVYYIIEHEIINNERQNILTLLEFVKSLMTCQMMWSLFISYHVLTILIAKKKLPQGNIIKQYFYYKKYIQTLTP